MKVLFLDIDGVCNSAKSPMDDLFPIDREAAARVARIVAYTDCKVVLSSSWRFHPEARDIVGKKVVPIYDMTSLERSESRGADIKEWLKNHPEVTQYAILDDDDDFDKDQHLFRTKWEDGLTDETTEAVIKHLNKGDE